MGGLMGEATFVDGVNERGPALHRRDPLDGLRGLLCAVQATASRAGVGQVTAPVRSYPQPLDLDELEEKARGALFFRSSSGFEFMGDKEGYARWIAAGAGSHWLHTHAAETILALIGMLRGSVDLKGKGAQ